MYCSTTEDLIEFPNATRCIRQLNRLGPPPTHMDFTKPTKKLETTFRIFMALSHHIDNDKTVSQHIRIHWHECLRAWIDFIFRNIILSRERPPQNSPVDYFECSVNNLPVILLVPAKDARWIENETPGLVHALLQSWYLLLELVHPASDDWKALILSYIKANPNCLPPSTTHDPPVLYYEDAHLGEVIVGCLDRAVHHVRKKPVQNLHSIHDLLTVITKICMLHESPPMFMGPNVNRTLHLMAKLCDSLLLAKKSRLRNGTVHSMIYREAHAIIVMCYNIVLKGMNQPIHVHRMLKDKFLETMMSVDSRFLRLDQMTPHRELQFQHVAARILDHISIFLLYPSTLRQFTRISHHQQINGVKFIESGANTLWSAWTNLNDKGGVFYSVRLEMKKRIGICSSPECHLKRELTTHHQEVQYLRCLGCEYAIYCSHACRKAHWKKEHNTQCPEFATEITNGQSPTVRDNVQFFAFVLEHHLRLFADTITERVKASTPMFEGYSFGDISLQPGTRQPFVLVELYAANLPEGITIEVVDQKMLHEWARTGYLNSSNWLPSFLNKWANTEHDEIVIVAAFPKTLTSHWPFVKAIDFPLKHDLEFNYIADSTLRTT